MEISILLCTRNRASHLRHTLDAMCRIAVPVGAKVELLVIDNASSDETSRVIEECKIPQLTVSYLREPRKGQANARNAGLREAKGEIIIFTDDDVRPSKKWIEGVCDPIAIGLADAVSGLIALRSREPFCSEYPLSTPN